MQTVRGKASRGEHIAWMKIILIAVDVLQVSGPAALAAFAYSAMACSDGRTRLRAVCGEGRIFRATMPASASAVSGRKRGGGIGAQQRAGQVGRPAHAESGYDTGIPKPFTRSGSEHHAGTQTRLRTLQQAPAAGLHRSAHLLV
ncbi:protein of unknown function [Cupriavidus taiwanensis]|nr:protein of unknown function [Cupriavidus taiwanensis]